MLSGRIVRPSDSDYDAARADYNARFSVRPQLIVFAATVDDVANAVRWARENKVPLRPRSGRHSYEAYSLVDNGLVLDVSAMSSVAIDTAARTARVGAGCTLLPLYTQLAQSGLTLPSGSCNSLGIAGVTLGGGYGLLSRQLGLTCDQLLGADLVTADGKTVRASPSQNPDLFWALRGGGGGNFGVVTAFDFAVQPIVATVAIYNLSWSIADFPSVMSAWQKWAPYADPALFSTLAVDQTHVYAAGMYLGTVDDMKKLMAPLLAAGTPQNPQYQALAYIDAVRQFGADSGTPKFKGSSGYIQTALPDAAFSVIQQRLQAAPSPNATLQFDALGGVIANVAAGATAFAHRQALFNVQLEAYWTSDADEAAHRRWVGDTRVALAPYTDGAYVNYIDADIVDFATAYYGSNRAQLAGLKRTWDPDGFFSFPQSVPTS
jgi:FAD/FMN-containing dehydrogenase